MKNLMIRNFGVMKLAFGDDESVKNKPKEIFNNIALQRGIKLDAKLNVKAFFYHFRKFSMPSS